MGRIALILLCLALKVSPSAQGFDFSDVQALARARAAQPYQASTNRVPPVLANLKYEQYQSIRFKPSQALWLSNSLPFYIEFFHCGHFHRDSVQIHEVVKKQVQEVPFRKSCFDYGTNIFDLPADLGFAGFRVVHRGKSVQEAAVFLDASYFRMIGTRQDYGTSARGLALDTIETPKEEFPVFQQFWLCRPNHGDDSLTVYALMDSPAVAGAYRFKIEPGTDTVAQVNACLVQRHGVHKFGVAPLSSMFLHGKNGRPLWHDFRPEVHDADGLLIHNGTDEWIWHPLEAGKMMRVNAFSDENPKGFGLIQRERDFEQYQDLFAHFQNRPSVWIRTRGKWGKGAVELVQFNSAIEFTDNVVAYWLPRELPAPGTPISFDYDIQWSLTDPSTHTGKVIASRVSRVPDTKNLRFVVDFGGRDMEALTAKEQLALDLKFSNHVQFVSDSIFKNRFNQTWRVVVEVVEPGKVADFKIFLKRREKQITETWTFTWQP